MKHKHPPLCPVVHMPLADKFNQPVCINLKDHNESWILNIFDSVTKYSAVCLISSEHQDEIVAGIYLIQIAPSLSKKVLNSLMTNAGR